MLNHGLGYGMDWWMWVLMVLGTIGFWTLVAWTVRAVIEGRPGTSSSDPAAAERLRLLDERLARGEIEPEEHRRIRKALRRAHRVNVSPPS